MEESNFVIGDRVRSLSTEMEHVGVVDAIFSAEYFLHGRDAGAFDRWNEAYPGWLNNIVIIVKLDVPQRNLSLEEFTRWVRKQEYDMTPAQVQDYYNREVGYQYHVGIPIEAVERL